MHVCTHTHTMGGIWLDSVCVCLCSPFTGMVSPTDGRLMIIVNGLEGKMYTCTCTHTHKIYNVDAHKEIKCNMVRNDMIISTTSFLLTSFRTKTHTIVDNSLDNLIASQSVLLYLSEVRLNQASYNTSEYTYYGLHTHFSKFKIQNISINHKPHTSTCFTVTIATCLH